MQPHSARLRQTLRSEVRGVRVRGAACGKSAGSERKARRIEEQFEQKETKVQQARCATRPGVDGVLTVCAPVVVCRFVGELEKLVEMLKVEMPDTLHTKP